MMTAKQSKELKKLCDPKRIVNELKSHLDICSGSDIIDFVKVLEKENKKLKEEIKHKNEKFSEWCEENKELKEYSDNLEEQIEEYIQTEKVFDENDEKMKTELVMMYSIIMNDGVKSEIPFLNCADTITILKSNITLMLEKFKTMGEKYDKLEEQEELKSIGKDDENGNYQDIIEDLEQANKELQEENKELNANFKEEREEKKKLKEENKTSNDVNIKLKDDNVKLIDEIECMKSHSDMSEEEYEGELKDKEAIVNYLTDELHKFKKLFDESKKENQKAKDIKGIVVNEDKTIITINGVELNIGDIFTTDNTEYILKEIYVGKSGKYSLRTDKITIRIGNSFITGKFKIFKKE